MLNGTGEEPITVVFRYDDYSSRSPTILEVALLDAFRDRGVPCTFGVVPYITPIDEDPAPQEMTQLTPEKANILQSAVQDGILEVAQHGYSHHTILNKERGGWSEFFGLDYDTQARKIAEGKCLLEEMLGSPITTFIPPWNSYDLNTVRAVEAAGLQVFSAGRRGVIARSSPLAFLSWTSDLQSLPNAVRSARTTSNGRRVVVVMFHPADLALNAKTGMLASQHLELLDWVTSQPDVQVCTVGETAQAIKQWSMHRFKYFASFTAPVEPRPFFMLPGMIPAKDQLVSALYDTMAVGILMGRELRSRFRHQP